MNNQAPPVHPVQPPQGQQPIAPAQPPVPQVGQLLAPQPPQQQAAPQPPQPGAILQPPVPILRRYQEYFSVDVKDPHQGDYNDASQDFLAPLQGNSRHNPQALADRVNAASDHDIPMAFVKHCRDPNVANDIGYIQVFLRVSKYPTTVVGPAQPWDGHTYALVGDIVNGQYTIAPFPNTNMNLAPNARSRSKWS